MSDGTQDEGIKHPKVVHSVQMHHKHKNFGVTDTRVAGYFTIGTEAKLIIITLADVVFGFVIWIWF